MLNPAFTYFPDEMAIIGEMVLSYTELDFMFCHSAGIVLGNKMSVMTALHSVKQEAARIDIVNGLTRSYFNNRGLAQPYEQSYEAMVWCRSVRNLYAHATWDATYGHPTLDFIDVHGTEWQVLNTKLKRKTTNLALLKEQLAFHEYAKACLLHLETEMSANPGRHPLPPRMHPPKKHLGA